MKVIWHILLVHYIIIIIKSILSKCTHIMPHTLPNNAYYVHRIEY